MNLLDIYEYNQHFVAMMNIINNSRINNNTEGHKHHIIPKCWFKKHNIEIDNSETNTVYLLEEDHCRVHKLAALCIIGADMRSAMAFAVHRLHGSFRGMHHTKEARLKISKNNARVWKGKVPPAALMNKGRIFTEEHRKKLAEAHLGRTWKVIDGKRVFSKRVT